MRKGIFFFVLSLVFLTLGCSREQSQAPLAPGDQEGISIDLQVQAFALALAEQAGWPIEASTEELGQAGVSLAKCSPAPLVNFQRTAVAGDVAHYSARLRVGSGPYDVIGLHRIVREKRPWQPVKRNKSFFFQHGSSKDFIGMMQPGLYSPSTSDDFGLAYYLARHDVDVWGIDQGWTLVPATVTNTDFMLDWGLERQVSDLRTAIGVARLTRILTGCGLDKMVLAGYSNGVPTVVSVVNEESQLRPALRQIGGLVPVDNAIKVDAGPMKEALTWYSETYREYYKNGMAGEPVTFALMADMVRNNPDGHDFDATMTNVDFVMTMVTGPTLFPGHPFHYWAANWENGKPIGLRFTERELWLDFLASGTAWEPYIWTADWCGYVAGLLDTRYDDHLGDIRIPILNLTPGGGYADATLYGISLFGSSDIQHLRPTLGPPVEADFAHIDLFTSADAEHLVWQPLLQWINTH